MSPVGTLEFPLENAVMPCLALLLCFPSLLLPLSTLFTIIITVQWVTMKQTLRKDK